MLLSDSLKINVIDAITDTLAYVTNGWVSIIMWNSKKLLRVSQCASLNSAIWIARDALDLSPKVRATVYSGKWQKSGSLK